MSNVKETILKEINKTEWYKNNPITLEELEENLLEHLTESGEDICELDRETFRWWDEFTIIKKIGDKYFSYIWASANRDESIFDLGWCFDYDSLIEVEPYEETVIQTKYKPINT